MKLLVFSALLVVVLAEPPRLRSRFRFQRQELATFTTDSATEPTTEPSGPYPAAGWKPAQPFNLPRAYGAPQQAPYSPSGWKPQGQRFTLPKQQLPPTTNYGAPDSTYGLPDTYGAPTTDNPNATANPAEVESLEGPVEVQKTEGQYYILLPNGQLQKVEFMTESDVKNMAYTAKLKLSERAPLYLIVV